MCSVDFELRKNLGIEFHLSINFPGKSRVNVIDSNRPGDVILTFDILAANVLCIATVAGNI